MPSQREGYAQKTTLVGIRVAMTKTRKGIIHHSPFTTHHSQFIIHNSPFIKLISVFLKLLDKILFIAWQVIHTL